MHARYGYLQGLFHVIGGYELLATLDTLPVRLTRERPNQDCQIVADIRLRISKRRRVKTPALLTDSLTTYRYSTH